MRYRTKAGSTKALLSFQQLILISQNFYFAKLDTAFKETNNSHKSQALTAKRINANATIAIPQITAQ